MVSKSIKVSSERYMLSPVRLSPHSCALLRRS